MDIVNIDYDLEIDYDLLMGLDWADVFGEHLLKTPYMENLMLFLHEKYKGTNIYPRKKDLFKCFKETDFTALKVVVLCREPYIDGKATGIPLANNEGWGAVFSPELTTFMRGIEKSEYDNFRMYGNPALLDIVNQGVLFMDVALTSSDALEPMQHKMQWKNFTRQVIKTICEWHEEDIVFVLLGEEAEEFAPYISKTSYIVHGEHPYEAIEADKEWNYSFLSDVNKILKKNGGEENQIIW